MGWASGYILVLAKHPRQTRMLTGLLKRLHCSVEVACDEVAAIALMVARPPFLIILTGNHQDWSETLLTTLRSHSAIQSITLVIVADFHAPNWIHQEENPGFDGFLVNPISSEVLFFLVQSAYTRRSLCLVS
jgi:AmiR/NasT family two-component response regulator